jgi:hypothetical protein
MKIKDGVKEKFQTFENIDATVGRKLSDSDYFISSEANQYGQPDFWEIKTAIDKNLTKIKTTKKSMRIGSNEIKIEKNKDNQEILEKIDKAIDILNNEIMDLEKDISMNMS